jgi:ribonuclease-3
LKFRARLKSLYRNYISRQSKHELDKLFSDEKLAEFEEVIGYKINNQSYFVKALLHRSFLEQNTDYEDSNERLEFLGDAVLSLVTAEYLYKKFPDENEGFLTKVRANFVNKLALADAAESIALSEFLLVGKNLSAIFTQNSKTITADAFEAVIGAIFLDSGLSAAKKFVLEVLIEPYARAGIHLIDENFKSQLLEYAQAKRLEVPVYSVIKEEGPHHNKVFTIQVLIGDKIYGVGSGKSKKFGEQNAAEEALKKIATENNH